MTSTPDLIAAAHWGVFALLVVLTFRPLLARFPEGHGGRDAALLFHGCALACAGVAGYYAQDGAIAWLAGLAWSAVYALLLVAILGGAQALRSAWQGLRRMAH